MLKQETGIFSKVPPLVTFTSTTGLFKLVLGSTYTHTHTHTHMHTHTHTHHGGQRWKGGDRQTDRWINRWIERGEEEERRRREGG